MAGYVADTSVVTGAKAGLSDVWDTFNTSINNQYLFEIIIIFIGVASMIGLIKFLFGRPGTFNVRNNEGMKLGSKRGFDGVYYASGMSLAEYERKKKEENSGYPV